jgi:LysM repeat protein
MNHRELQLKRQPLQRNWIRRIHAKIKRPASTAAANPAELDGDIPNMNVGRALIVIVILQVVGVAGFFAHRYFERNSQNSNDVAGASHSPVDASSVITAERQRYDRDGRSASTLPQIQRDDDRHMVLAGDTYHSIARKWNISEDSLRAANQHINLCSGLILRIPPREIAPVAAPAQVSTTPASSIAIRVQPNINLENAPRAIPVGDFATPSGTIYRVRKGDTFSKIARDHGVSVSALMKHNGITNDRSLRVDQRLKIPTNQL